MKYNKLIPELYVLDLTASLAFYGKAGFSMAYDRPETGFAFLEREGNQLMLQQWPGTSDWGPKTLSYPNGNGINFQMEVSGIAELYSSLAQAGCAIVSVPEEVWYRSGDVELGNREFLVRDPDGYLLRFFEDLGERPIKDGQE